MIINKLAVDTKISERRKTLAELRFVTFNGVYEYDILMPKIRPIDNQIHFF